MSREDEGDAAREAPCDAGDEGASDPERSAHLPPGADRLPDDASDGDDDPVAPPLVREPLLRDRVRDRLGVSPRQWYVLETLLLVAPYPLFVYGYFAFDVDENLFIVVTLAYSLVAMYVGFLS